MPSRSSHRSVPFTVAKTYRLFSPLQLFPSRLLSPNELRAMRPASLCEASALSLASALCFVETTHLSLKASTFSPELHAFAHLVPSAFSPFLHLEKPYLFFITQFRCLRLTRTLLPRNRVDGTFLGTTLDLPPAWPSTPPAHVLPPCPRLLHLTEGSLDGRVCSFCVAVLMLGPCRESHRC